MPKRTPKRDLLEAHTGSLFPTDVVARNLRAYRRAQELSQEDVGRRMSICGHDWSAGIVGFVERGDRNVTVDELVALAVVLGRPLPALLDPTVDPTGLEGRLELGLDFPGHDIASAPLPAQVAAQFVRGDAVLRFRTENPPTFEMTKADAEDERLHELPEHGSKGWLGLGGLPEEIDKEFAARASSVIEEWKGFGMTANTAALVEQLKQAMGTDEQRRSLYQRMLKASEDLDDASVDEHEETPR